jgi:membrane-associated phospholipid phosphatase
MARACTALLLFLGVAAATFLLPSHRLDVAVTAWLQRAAPGPDVAASVFVFLGDAEVVIPAAVLAGLVLWPRHRARAAAALWLAAGLAVLSGVAVALKFVLPHPGPPPEFQREVARFGVGLTQPFSFPSGHTTRTTFIAATALRRAPLIAATVVGAMMTALVYLGDHWTSDVVGGLCIGWAGAEAARLVIRGLGKLDL